LTNQTLISTGDAAAFVEVARANQDRLRTILDGIEGGVTGEVRLRGHNIAVFNRLVRLDDAFTVALETLISR